MIKHLHWIALVVGNLIACGVAYVWIRFGWRWALALFVAAPIVCLGLAALALILFFFLDPHEPPCRRCGVRTPLQLRGPRYRRPHCDDCDRALRAELLRTTGSPDLPEEFRV